MAKTYTTNAGRLYTDDGIRIIFRESKNVSEDNPLGIPNGRFDLTDTLGIYKHGRGKENIRWFLVEIQKDPLVFSATEIEIPEVYELLKKYGFWVEPEYLNQVKSQKYRPVWEWRKQTKKDVS